MAPRMPFSVEAVDVLDTVLIRVCGPVDLATVPLLALELASCEDRRCELDLSQVTFADSTTLNTLLGHRRRAEVRGGTLRVVGVSPPVRLVFHITGTTALFLSDPDRPGDPRP